LHHPEYTFKRPGRIVISLHPVYPVTLLLQPELTYQSLQFFGIAIQLGCRRG